MRSHRGGADGVVGIDELFRNAFLRRVPFLTTPSAPLKEASRLLLDVASTPPVSGGEWRAQFIHTPLIQDRACKPKWFYIFVSFEIFLSSSVHLQ